MQESYMFCLLLFLGNSKNLKQKKHIKSSQAESGHCTHIDIIMNNIIWKFNRIWKLPGLQKD